MKNGNKYDDTGARKILRFWAHAVNAAAMSKPMASPEQSETTTIILKEAKKEEEGK